MTIERSVSLRDHVQRVTLKDVEALLRKRTEKDNGGSFTVESNKITYTYQTAVCVDLMGPSENKVEFTETGDGVDITGFPALQRAISPISDESEMGLHSFIAFFSLELMQRRDGVPEDSTPIPNP